MNQCTCFIGWVEDLTKSWNNVFYITGILQLLAAVVALTVSRCYATPVSERDVAIEREYGDAADDKLIKSRIE